MLRKSAWLLDLLGLTLLAALAASIITRTLEGELAAPEPIPRVDVAIARSHMTLDGDRLATLLGARAPTPGRALISRLPLRVRLDGTVVGRDPRWSWAMVSDPSGARPLVVGDALGDGFIEAIDGDQIVVRRGELRQVIRFGPEVDDDLPATRDPGALSLTHAERDALLRSPELLTGARFTPQFIDGRFTGLLASAVRPGSVFARLGLQNGDVVRRIDGVDTGDLGALVGHLPALLQANRVQVELVRGGATSQVAVELRD